MFRLKQYAKMMLQNILLPIIYNFYSRRPVRKGSVLFADAHHEDIPFSMRRMYETVQDMEEKLSMEEVQLTKMSKCAGEMQFAETREPAKIKHKYKIENFICDFNKLSFSEMIQFLLRFMKSYATAEYVFICDYFLPAASCRKRPETKLIQLWHSCGLMKKIAFDAGEDIPKNYKGNMFGNYSFLTMSAEICVPVHARALRLPQERIHATGISRTDVYFEQEWNERCRRQFQEKHPEAEGKKIALWAPTFRGNAAMPRLEGLEEIRKAAEDLDQDWYFVIKAHPHVDAHGMVSNSAISTEELFPVADVLITDYSSVLFDYLIYGKPAVLFAPDLEQYRENRGFYLDYHTVPFAQTQTLDELETAILGSRQWQEMHREEIEAFRELYTGACDGQATERILKLIGMESRYN